MDSKINEVLVFKTGTFDKITGHETVHSLLGECLHRCGLEYSGEPRLGHNEHGKPYLKDCSDVHFNLSHAKGICACFISPFECGADCENVRPYRPRVMERCYTSSEIAMVEALDGTERDIMFFRLWTLKEAYVKAIGIGISYPMKNIEFIFESEKLYSNIPDCSFEQYIIDDTNVLSLCRLGDDTEGFVKHIMSCKEKMFLK